MAYIDADKLHYSRVRIVHTDGTIGGYHAVVMSAEIKDAPTADVVEVVRCKDCKHWDKFPDCHRTDGTCTALVKWHYAERYMTEADHFCSYGERK